MLWGEGFAVGTGGSVFSGTGFGGVGWIDFAKRGEEGFPVFLRRTATVGICLRVGVVHSENSVQFVISSPDPIRCVFV